MYAIPINNSESKWVLPMVSLIGLALLLLFYFVVADAVKAGELRKQATAVHKTAILNCSTLRDVNNLKSCIKGLDTQVSQGASALLAAK